MPQLRAEVLRCPWELRDLLAELGEKHERVEAVRTIEPGEARHDPFWHNDSGDHSIQLWIRISGDYCQTAHEGYALQCTEITEYIARRAELLKRQLGAARRGMLHCDGEHAGPVCPDENCWQRKP